eukprot:248794-Pelagomonas_calceolata.AAC.1
MKESNASKVLCWVKAEPLGPLDHYTDLVNDPSAGAITTFVGVTRNSFQGKGVLYLEYEAYEPMAMKKLQGVGEAMAAKWDIVKVALAHRVGRVGVSEPSVIIAVSSAHRRDALEV